MHRPVMTEWYCPNEDEHDNILAQQRSLAQALGDIEFKRENTQPMFDRSIDFHIVWPDDEETKS